MSYLLGLFYFLQVNNKIIRIVLYPVMILDINYFYIYFVKEYTEDVFNSIKIWEMFILMLDTNGINLTMLSIPCVKSKYLNDDQSQKLVEQFQNPDEYQKDCDAVYDGFLTRNVLTRHKYFSEFMSKISDKYTQVLIMSVGLDTKPDTLNCLEDKNIFGCDIAIDDIKQIYEKTGVQTKTNLVECNIETDINDEFIEKLVENGFKIDEPTLLVWEGGTFYITKSAVNNALRFLNKKINLEAVVIDYMNASVFNPPRHDKAQRQLELVAKIAVPWKSFYSKQEIEELYQSLQLINIDITEHGDVEEKVMGNVKLDHDIMYLTSGYK